VDTKKSAKELLELQERAKSWQANFRSLWQSVSDLIFPQTFGISNYTSPGSNLMLNLFDTTAVTEARNMASGLSNNLFPAGQRFFDLVDTPDSGANRYQAYLVEEAHELIFKSNFLAQVNNAIHYWLTFGISCTYSAWDIRNGLHYRDYPIGTYQCMENEVGVIDTMILTCPMTARQLVMRFKDPGPSVVKAYANPETQNQSFDMVWVVRPRADRDPGRLDNLNMPFESIYVQRDDQVIIEEGGFPEFPFAVPRYEVVYQEVYGRGQGVMMLPKVRMLNRLAKDFIENSNKWVRPPLEVLESFEGDADLTPGAENIVQQIGSIAAIDLGAKGSFPIGKDIIEHHQEEIRQGFFKNAFQALSPLTGDRRTQIEIIERLKEGMKQLSKPIGRLFDELLTPILTRSLLLLIRNGVVPPPPRELQGMPIKINLINPLALALRDQQSRGLQYWVGALDLIEPLFPGTRDNVDADRAFRDLGRSLGVKVDHIRPIRQRDEIRRQRAEEEAEKERTALALAAAEGYSKITAAPQEGSPLAN